MLVTILGIALALWLAALGMLILGVFSSDTNLPPSPRPNVPRLLNSSHMEEVINILNIFSLRKIQNFSPDCSMLFMFIQMVDGNLVSYVSTKFKAPATDDQRSIFYNGQPKKLQWPTKAKNT